MEQHFDYDFMIFFSVICQDSSFQSLDWPMILHILNLRLGELKPSCFLQQIFETFRSELNFKKPFQHQISVFEGAY